MASIVAASITDKFKGAMNQAKAAMGQQEQAEKGLLQQADEACTLTWKQRLIGFGCCLGFGLLLTILSIPMIWMLRFVPFAIFYSVGSLVSIASTCFLMGPVKQVQRMFEQKRLLATIVYLTSIILTVVVAFTIHSGPLCLIFIVIQFVAFLYYVLTWIPGGQEAVKAMIFRGS